ncbi:YihY/virulence factor BrkB family protein [Actinomadura barringtoniae]|uniref:YihY/virulence factor BrkB family protein n=1 Tax=Actinomadura barringtoniae TaxID=1427535 RepID=A0A939T6L5_9ACTN|nr:YihY/virulence factor BrkB family protein [Actinomadura barringtoniae]MBO2452093.1 YihY/virulence factor BrkB family protein [Actinomadura barringtoniae]
MRQVIARAQRRFGALQDTGMDLLRGFRARWPWFDHLVRAYRRYQDRRGDRLAAALTCYGFLSFFPLLALAYALLGYLVKFSGKARDYFVDAINQLLPGLADQLNVQQIVESKTAVGLVGLVGLMFTGLGWVNVLRESLRDIWGYEPTGGANFFLKKVLDAGLLAFLGVVLIVSVAVSTVTSQATHTVLTTLGLDEVAGAGTALRLLSLAVAISFDTLIFLVLFSRLSGTRAPWRKIIRGAVFGAIGFEILKQIATLLLSRTTSNPVYASFAVLVGLMVWINIVSRFLLFTAAWTATRRVIMRADEKAQEKEQEQQEQDAQAQAQEDADLRAEHQSDQQAEQQAERPAEQQAEQQAERPAEQQAEQQAERPAEQQAEQQAERPAERQEQETEEARG